LVFTGFLNINKPAGITSFATVARVKELIRQPHIGHAGTLDPEATGVLPIAFGPATRLIEYLSDSSKVYRAGIELGVTTDTYDGSGRVTGRKDPSGIDLAMINIALATFKGTIMQVPPMFSALRHNGERLYRMARAGIEIERPPREVRIFRIEVSAFQLPFLTLEIECGKGTYIRALANDLGGKLGCGALMKTLTRQRVGGFDIAGAISLEVLAESCRYGFWERYVYAPDSVILQQTAVVIGGEKEAAMKQGQKLRLTGEKPGDPGENRRVYTRDGRFTGIIKYDAAEGVWWPEKVF
jgi:tRNA pseudouridine55 synthase